MKCSWFLFAAAGLCACAHATSTTHAAPASRTAVPRPAASAAPSLPAAAVARVARAVSATPSSAAASLPARSPSPSPSPPVAPTPLRLPPDAPPQIVNVHLASTVLHPGETVRGSVATSSNVASVELRIATYSIVMHKAGVGRFTVEQTVANLPFFLLGTYDMHVIARNSAGDSVERILPLTIR